MRQVDVLAESMQGGTSKRCPNGGCEMANGLCITGQPPLAKLNVSQNRYHQMLVPQDALLKEVPKSKELERHSHYNIISFALKVTMESAHQRVLEVLQQEEKLWYFRNDSAKLFWPQNSSST